MDADHFDALARSLTAAGSRRRAFVIPLGGALGLLGLAHPDDAPAAKFRKCRPTCAECEKCQKGDCKRKNGRRVCKKGKCKPKADGTPCSNFGKCQGGTCAVPYCAGKNACTDGVDGSTCHNGSEVCYCFVTAATGEPYCGTTAAPSPCSGCSGGETCVNLGGGHCGMQPTACGRPCPNPL